MAQAVKNLLAVWEIWIQSLGQEDPPKQGMAIHSGIEEEEAGVLYLQKWVGLLSPTPTPPPAIRAVPPGQPV